MGKLMMGEFEQLVLLAAMRLGAEAYGVSIARALTEQTGKEISQAATYLTLKRLEEKGWLKHREEGRTFIYAANRPRSVSLGAKVAQMVDRLFAGSPEEMVTALIEYRGLSPDESERIRDMIDEADTKQKRNTKQREK